MACKRTIALFILLTVKYSEIDGELMVVPSDTVSKVNQSVYFNCTTDLESVVMFWLHGQNLVYAGDTMLSPYDVGFEIERNNKSYNLVIHSVKPGDAGEYACAEDRIEEKSSAQLTVLDNDPICPSNITLREVTGPNNDTVELLCSVTFHGQNPPPMEWTKSGDNTSITDGMSNFCSDDTCNITLQLKGNTSLNKSTYVCQIAQSPYECHSDIIYRSDSKGMVNEENTSTQHQVAPDETLANTLTGEYQCLTNGTIRGIECSVDMTEEPPQPSSACCAKIAGTVAGLLLAGSTVIAVVMILHLRRKNKRMEDFIAREVRSDLRSLKISEEDVDHLINKLNEHLGSGFSCVSKLKTDETQALQKIEHV